MRCCVLYISLMASTLAPTTDRVAAEEPASPEFRNQVMAVLSRSGCNLGTCHGNAHGKGGFKLSLRGQDPDADYDTLTRKSASRLVTTIDPDASLLLRKPTMVIPHEGGRRFSPDSRSYRILRDWIRFGLQNNGDTDVRLVTLNVTPSRKTVYAPEVSVQIRVQATFSDGSVRDVTDLTVFESSATFVFVSPDGVARAERDGTTTVVARYLDQQLPVRLEFVPARPDFEFEAPQPTNVIDEAVFAQLKRLKINPSPVCDDTTFLRRVYLDLTGLLPPVESAKTFLASSDPGKRSQLIDELLASSEFHDFQTVRWADLLRVEEKTLDKKGVEVFHDWIHASVSTNKPLNEFAAELIAARGSTYTVPPTNFYRALRKPEERAESTAQVFLGIRLQCAKCHNHPFDRWTQDDYYGWSNFFARIEYEIIENKRRDKNDKHEFDGEQIVKITTEGDVKNPDTGKPAGLRYLGASIEDTAATNSVPSDTSTGSPAPDRLQRLAAWLSDPSNERFAATQANRIWAQLMGQGVVDPIDDFRSTNPPSNPELLTALRNEFVDHDFDVRHLMRLILNSKSYQLAWQPNNTNEQNPECFARTVPRRLTAEQTADAMSQVLGVPVQYGGHDAGTRATQLKGVRNGGHRYSVPEIGDRFLALFGKPGRLQSCDCERSNETTLAQSFEMVSGELVNWLLTQSNNRIALRIAEGYSDDQIVKEFYWSALTRPPTESELKSAVSHVGKQSDRLQGHQDIVWALLNSNEFLLRK